MPIFKIVSHGFCPDVYTAGVFGFVGIQIQCFDETGKFGFWIHVLCVNSKQYARPKHSGFGIFALV